VDVTEQLVTGSIEELLFGQIALPECLSLEHAVGVPVVFLASAV
jgi:hypothetical protein